MFAVLFALVAALAVLGTVVRRYDRRLLGYAAAGLGMHVSFAFAQLWITENYYGVSDVFAYAEYAKPLVRALDLDFVRFAPEVLKLALHMETRFSYGGTDGSTTMIALSGFLFFLVGNSLLACFIVVSVISWFGQVLLAFVAGDCVKDDEKPLAYAATLLVPSVVFWSSAIVKEGVVLAALGLLCFAVHRVFVRGQIPHVAGVVVGAVTIAMLKPYTLFPFVVGIAGWVFARRNANSERAALRLGPLVIAGLLAVVGILAIGSIFPEFGLDKIGERTAAQQQAWAESDNSSNVDIGAAAGSTSLASQVPYVPLALVNSLFRPFLFEARNLTTFAASLETTALMALVAQSLARLRVSRLRDALLRSPLLTASAVFVASFAVAIGLATKNLGSLSRYRMPMIPFYVLVVLVVRHRLRAKENESRNATLTVGSSDSEGEAL